MKKLLLMGFVTLAFASCVSDKEVAPQTQNQKYDAAFENLVGGKVNANVNWGFNDQTPLVFDKEGKVISGMRAANTNNNQWGGYLEVPDEVTDAIRTKVTKYFNETENPQGIAVNWSDFFVQQVSSNGNAPFMNHLTCGNKKTGADKIEDHINNYNAGYTPSAKNVGVASKGDGSNNCIEVNYYDGIMYVENSATEFFAFHDSYDSQYYYDNFVIIPGEMIDAAYPNMQPSLAGMWFVGFDYEHDKTKASETDNDIQPRDFYFNDWIVRISPGIFKDGQRVFAEDLIDSSLEKVDVSDWDFNDAVFDVRFQTSWPNGVETKEAIITLWAAGGTKNLTIAGKEVHELFGVPTNTMVNTNAANGKDGLAPVIFRVKTNATNAIDIPVKVGSIELTAKQGEATQKMAVAYGTKWMKERKLITGSYTSFQAYVRDNDPTEWYKTVTNTGDLYTPIISTYNSKH